MAYKDLDGLCERGYTREGLSAEMAYDRPKWKKSSSYAGIEVLGVPMI